ncbi:ABC transporter permease subunit [Weissella confusa]|uniref:ABC transporter permease subunit n=1 Tax=Weissella confusa TaxID=1583 RepID=A0A923NHG0_WEICO|nr:ABC transporter permease subunit [Weissella confusa]
MAPLATSARFIRTEMVDVLGSDYIELARAKGLSKREVIWKHAMRNSLIPLVTLIGPMAVNLFAGIGLGSAAAVRRNTKTDTILSIIAVLGISIPSFVFAALLQYWVGLKLDWLPIAGWKGFSSTILPSQQKMIEAQYGLDKPIFIQYVTYLWDALHFDFGVSFQFANQEVSTLIAQRMGPSAQLGIQALIFGVLFN